MPGPENDSSQDPPQNDADNKGYIKTKKSAVDPTPGTKQDSKPNNPDNSTSNNTQPVPVPNNVTSNETTTSGAMRQVSAIYAVLILTAVFLVL